MENLKEIRVVAAVVIRSDGKILCARRGNAKNPDVAWKWEFPGGKIDSGETPEEALSRELLEEMNLRVSVGEKITTVRHRYPNCLIEMDAFLCVPENENTEPELREHAEAAWLTRDELFKPDWAEADRPIVRILCER